MLVGEHAFVMLGTREKFAQLAKLPVGDPTTHTLALYCLSVSSREEVDAVSAAAIAAGGTEADGAEDYGFMYSRSFFDLDSHGWQVMWMDPAATEQGPEAFAASAQPSRRSGQRPTHLSQTRPSADRPIMALYCWCRRRHKLCRLVVSHP
jgi:uncharacterized protein